MKRLAVAAALVVGAFSQAFADFSEGVFAHKRGDYVTAYNEFLPLARAGVADAQFFLGSMYSKGEGVTRDFAEAVNWWRKAAEQGNTPSQHLLGTFYANGQGVQQDHARAMKWWREAAKQGDAGAQRNIGVLYASGLGVPQDYAEAASWFSMAAENGNPSAQYNLGHMYRLGQGVAQDDVAALKWFYIAVTGPHKGAVAAVFTMSKMIDPADRSKAHGLALKWLEKNKSARSPTLTRQTPTQKKVRSEDATPFCGDVGGYETYMKKTGKVCRLN